MGLGAAAAGTAGVGIGRGPRDRRHLFEHGQNPEFDGRERDRRRDDAIRHGRCAQSESCPAAGNCAGGSGGTGPCLRNPRWVYEDPAGIKTGMEQTELLSRFGDPAFKITSGANSASLTYESTDHRVEVEMRGGQSVFRPDEEQAAAGFCLCCCSRATSSADSAPPQATGHNNRSLEVVGQAKPPAPPKQNIKHTTITSTCLHALVGQAVSPACGLALDRKTRRVAAYRPDDPKPPAPRRESARSASSHSTASYLAITICAMRSPAWIGTARVQGSAGSRGSRRDSRVDGAGGVGHRDRMLQGQAAARGGSALRSRAAARWSGRWAPGAGTCGSSTSLRWRTGPSRRPPWGHARTWEGRRRVKSSGC